MSQTRAFLLVICLLALWGLGMWGCARQMNKAVKRVEQPVDQRFRQPFPETPEAARSEIASLEQLIQARTKQDLRPGQPATACQRVCRASQWICNAANRICIIAKKYPKRPLFQKSCQKAQNDCKSGQSSCRTCRP